MIFPEPSVYFPIGIHFSSVSPFKTFLNPSKSGKGFFNGILTNTSIFINGKLLNLAIYQLLLKVQSSVQKSLKHVENQLLHQVLF